MDKIILFFYLLSVCKSEADIVFVVDSSGSINEDHRDNWDEVKNWLANLVKELEIGKCLTLPARGPSLGVRF